jgi:Conserved protein/domain typically associated with flavoprotein oxygenases, DIM6/NTAB family
MSSRSFDPVDWRSLELNPSALIGQEWMLVTPGKPGSWNTMTASWGGFGHLWNMDVAFVFVRPSRYSYGFMEREEGFTLSFFGESMRKALEVCGSVSGRDVDKAATAGISPRPFAVFHEGAKGPQRVGFEEARLVLSCRKVHSQDLDPAGFADPAIASGSYPRGDVHRLYVGAIEGAWTAR